MMPQLESHQPTLLVSSQSHATSADASSALSGGIHHDDQLRCSESVASSVLQDLSFGLSLRRETSVDDAMTVDSTLTSANASPAIGMSMNLHEMEPLQLNEQQQQQFDNLKVEEEDADMSEEGIDIVPPPPPSIQKESLKMDVSSLELDPNQSAENEFDSNSWELLINRLPAAVVRRLLLLSIQEHEPVRASVHQRMLQEVNQWREARLARLMNRLKRSLLKLQIASFYDRLVKVTSIACDCWEEQHAIVLEFCRSMEAYIFGAYEVGCDFRKHYPLCIEIFYMVIEGALKLSQINTQFDIAETLSDWTPETRYVPESFSKAKGFVACVFRLWSHVLHVSTVDSELQQNPPKLHRLFVWTVKHDQQKQLLSHLVQFEGNSPYTKNVALEVYQHFSSLNES